MSTAEEVLRRYRAALVRQRERVLVELITVTEERDRLVLRRKNLDARIAAFPLVARDVAHAFHRSDAA